jgi:hypothetical protein
VNRPAWLLAALGVLATLAACGSAHHGGAYTGRVFSVGQVQRAFAQLGLSLRRENRNRPGVVILRLGARRPVKASGLGSVTVATRRAAARKPPSLPGRVTRYANVSAFSRARVLDEVRGALAALRWGTLSQAKPARSLIVLGESIGPVWLGETRKRVEREVGPGRPTGPGLVAYLGGHVLVDYRFHDALYKRVMYLETGWSGFHTRSGAHVGSTRGELRRLYVTCVSRAQCYLEQGPWPDALATGFTLKNGKVVGIRIGYS